MTLESSYQDYEAEISDDQFDDVFEENYEESYDDNSDSIFYDNSNENDLNLQIEALESEIEGLSSEDAYNHIAEAWPALIPLITALAPMAIQAVTQLAPVAVKAVGGFVGKLSKPKQRRPAQRRPVQRVQSQRPIVRAKPVQATRCNCNTGGSRHSIAQIGQSALGSLANLLSNKGVQTALSGLANKGVSQALKLGNKETTAREGALLNAIAYLANEAQSETFDDQFPDALDYLVGFDGDFVADPDSSESRAQRFIELFNN